MKKQKLKSLALNKKLFPTFKKKKPAEE